MEISVDIRIANSEYAEFITFQYCCSFCIGFHLIWVVMTTTIKLNYQLSLCTIEIYDVISNCFLTLESHRIGTKKFIP